MGEVIDILEKIIERLNKGGPGIRCLSSTAEALRRHTVGFNGEAIARDTLKKMGYKNPKITRHKDRMDIITGRTSWEVKTVSYDAKHWQMSVKPDQISKKLAWCKANKKKAKSMLILVNNKTEVFIRDGLGKFRPGGMKKVREIANWRATVSRARPKMLYDPLTLKTPKGAPKYLEVDFTKKGTGKAHFKQFVEARDNLPKELKPFVTSYTDKEYKKMGARLFMSADGKSGYALTKNNDIISLFSKNGAKQGGYALDHALRMGGETLDCFDGFLPSKYKFYGFEEYKRLPWKDKLAPKDWNYKKFGRPDVVFMRVFFRR